MPFACSACFAVSTASLHQRRDKLLLGVPRKQDTGALRHLGDEVGHRDTAGRVRFRFIGFALKILGGTASPIRAVAMFK